MHYKCSYKECCVIMKFHKIIENNSIKFLKGQSVINLEGGKQSPMTVMPYHVMVRFHEWTHTACLKITMQREMQWLRMRRYLPNAIGEINLSGNKLRNALPSIGNSSAVKRLFVSENPRLQLLNCSGFVGLEWLHAAHCALTVIPNLQSCSALTELTLQHNMLQELNLVGLSQLHLLNVSHNQLAELTLPSGIGAPNRLELNVVAHHNKLHNLGCLPENLIYLDVSHNGLERVPQLPQGLTYIDVSHNRLSTFPAPPAHLRHMNVSHNALTNAPLPSACLSEVDLSNNLLQDLHLQYADIHAHMNISHNRRMTRMFNFQADTVVAHGCGFSMPFSHRNGDVVDMVGCPLIEPLDLTPFHRAIILNLEDVGLTRLPDHIGQLRRLMVLSVSHNPELMALPEALGACDQLRELSLTNTAVSALPASLYTSTTMTTIMCDDKLRAAADQIISQAAATRAAASAQRRAESSSNSAGHAREHAREQHGNLKRWADMAQNSEPKLPDSALWDEWLFRLEGSSDFKWQRDEMVALVLEMLHHAEAYPDFCDTMLRTLEHDLAACGDRAAMSFNQLHTAYRVHAVCQGKPKGAAVLREYVQLARTLCLRRRVAQLVSKHGDNCESVEIYLYAEVQLRNRLGLTTGVHRMTHAALGNRSWLKLDDLAEWVMCNYTHDLFDAMDAQREALEEPLTSLNYPWEPAGNWDERLEAIERANMATQAYVNAMNNLMEERKRALHAQRSDWLAAQPHNRTKPAKGGPSFSGSK